MHLISNANATHMVGQGVWPTTVGKASVARKSGKGKGERGSGKTTAREARVATSARVASNVGSVGSMVMFPKSVEVATTSMNVNKKG